MQMFVEVPCSCVSWNAVSAAVDVTVDSLRTAGVVLVRRARLVVIGSRRMVRRARAGISRWSRKDDDFKPIIKQGKVSLGEN